VSAARAESRESNRILAANAQALNQGFVALWAAGAQIIQKPAPPRDPLDAGASMALVAVRLSMVKRTIDAEMARSDES